MVQASVLNLWIQTEIDTTEGKTHFKKKENFIYSQENQRI